MAAHSSNFFLDIKIVELFVLDIYIFLIFRHSFGPALLPLQMQTRKPRGKNAKENA